MAPGPVVEHFNVIEDIRPGQIPGFIYAFSDPFFFQRTEERFGHRIIPAVATRASSSHHLSNSLANLALCQVSPTWLKINPVTTIAEIK